MTLFESETLNSPEIQNANTQTYSNILKLSEIDPRALAFFRRSKFSLGSAEMATALGPGDRAMSRAKHGTECVRVRDDSMDNFGCNTGNLS